MAIMSSVGIAEILNAATEAMQWAGQNERLEVGEREKLREDGGTFAKAGDAQQGTSEAVVD